MMKKIVIVSGLVVCGVFFNAAPSPAAGQKDLRTLFEQGQKAFAQGKVYEAIRYYEDAVELNPNFAPAYNALALAYSQVNAELSDVIWLYKVAIDIDPDYAEPYHNLCRVYHQDGQYRQAEKYCLKALEINPNMTAAKVSLGWVYLVGLSEPKKAVPYFEEVSRVIRDNGMVYFGLGMAYALSGDYTRLMEAVTQLRSLGDEELAVKLESMVRQNVAARPGADYAAKPQPAQSTLIRSAPETPVPVEPVPQAGQESIGTMKIRLRGTLSNLSDPSQQQGSQATDDSMVPEETSAIERIRALQKLRGRQINIR